MLCRGNSFWRIWADINCRFRATVVHFHDTGLTNEPYTWKSDSPVCLHLSAPTCRPCLDACGVDLDISHLANPHALRRATLSSQAADMIITGLPRWQGPVFSSIYIPGGLVGSSRQVSTCFHISPVLSTVAASALLPLCCYDIVAFRLCDHWL